ncbi:MAG: hypothetical protein AAGC79_03215 [Pseudomonadota bacterium]
MLRRLAFILALFATTLPTLADEDHRIRTDYAQIADRNVLIVDGALIQIKGLDCPARGTAAGNRAFMSMQIFLEQAKEVSCTVSDQLTSSNADFLGTCFVKPAYETAAKEIDIAHWATQGGFCGRCGRSDPESHYGIYDPFYKGPRTPECTPLHTEAPYHPIP